MVWAPLVSAESVPMLATSVSCPLSRYLWTTTLSFCVHSDLMVPLSFIDNALVTASPFSPASTFNVQTSSSATALGVSSSMISSILLQEANPRLRLNNTGMINLLFFIMLPPKTLLVLHTVVRHQRR